MTVSEPKPRRDRGRRTLDERDIRELLFTTYATTVRVDQLAQLSAPDRSPALDDKPRRRLSKGEPKPPPKPQGGPRPSWPQGRHARVHAQMQIVNHWVELGYAEVRRPNRDQPLWVVTTFEGMERIGASFTSISFPEGNLEHLYLINEVRLFLLRATKIPQHTWTSEREIQANEPLKTRGLELPHRTDGIMTIEVGGTMLLGGSPTVLKGGERIAIEVERTRKDFKGLTQDILPDLLSHYDRVWYFANPGPYDAVSISRTKLSPEQQARLHIFRLNPHWWHWKHASPRGD